MEIDCGARIDIPFSISVITESFDFEEYKVDINQIFEELAPSIPDELDYLDQCRKAHDALTTDLINQSSELISRTRISELINGHDSNFKQFQYDQKKFIRSIERKVYLN